MNNQVGSPSARLPLSTSLVKLCILATTAIGNVLAAPLLESAASNGIWSSSHDHKEAEGRTTGQLIVDCLSIAALVLGGGLCAGLTLSLMGLDAVNLQVLSTAGSDSERKNAAKVLKLLDRGRHWVLVVLLLSNVIVNEALPVFLSDFGGYWAVLASTALIVIFGEVLPQSICARYGLSIGAACAPLVWILMVVLAPIAWPTAKLLDWSLGEDHGTTYKKAELKTFVSLHQQLGTENLNEDEVTIIRAVLDLNDKTVQDIMTPIRDVFILSADTVLDDHGVGKLVQSGYSRVPVHEKGKPDSIMGMLLVKDLITYDPEDGKEVSTFQLRPLPETAPDLSLLSTLNYFQTGRSHMLLVSTNPGQSGGALGVVTLEDVVEELIGEEIIDETDVWVDVHNRVRVARKPPGTAATANEADLGPLVRGIIERRRMGGLKQRTPLKASYGATANATPAADKVRIKRPNEPARAMSMYHDGDAKKKMSSPSLNNSPRTLNDIRPGSVDTEGWNGDSSSQTQTNEADEEVNERKPLLENGTGKSRTP
ncbi:hypothetical protein CBS101457_004390 [Exobasidium rhododendri]|nr:hypothetical protein CBS101457_004390 [Exobasidium rhododendri]